MNTQSSNLEPVPSAPQWHQSARPAWFRASVQEIEIAEIVAPETGRSLDVEFDEAHSANDAEFSNSPDNREHSKLPVNVAPIDANQTHSTNVVGQVFNLPKTRKKRQVTNLPHVKIGLLSGASNQVDQLESSRFRYRELFVGGALASLVFLAFGFGFLSRGIVHDANNTGMQVAGLSDETASRLAPHQPAQSGIALASSRQTADESDESAAKLATESTSAQDSQEQKPHVANASPMQAARQTAAAYSSVSDITGILAKRSLSSSSNMIPASLTDSIDLDTAVGDGAVCEDGQCSAAGPAEGTLGTLVAWADTPAEARAKARDTDKLVFLMHVSGNFEKPGFT
jgi:hypothetical protein